MKTVRFFAIDDDILGALKEIEQGIALKYVKAGVFRMPEGGALEVFESASEIPRLGYASHESASGCESFLVCKRDASIQKQRVTFDDGVDGFAINELLNQDAVTLTPAGLWMDNVVLYGTLGSAHGTEDATKLLKAFEKSLKRRFTKVKAFWVGPKALKALEEGKRLALAAQSPTDFDLSLA